MQEHPSPKPRATRGRPFELGEADELKGWRLSIFWPLALLTRLYLKTLQVRIDPAEAEALRQTPPGRTIVKWHSYSLVTARVLQKLFRPKQTAALISASLQGASQTRFYQWYGLHVERGSTSRRSLHALRNLIKLQRQGHDTLISPDGPSGPLHTYRHGALLLARKSNAPMIQFGVRCRFAIRAKTWDRHLIPFPFSTLEVRTQIIDPSELAGIDDEQIAAKLRHDLLSLSSP
ncbi:MAG: DUF374 domain-containing protein [Verrucomicrobiota bacterium]